MTKPISPDQWSDDAMRRLLADIREAHARADREALLSLTPEQAAEMLEHIERLPTDSLH